MNQNNNLNKQILIIGDLDVFVVFLLSFLTWLVIFKFPESPARFVLSLVFIFFLPGYSFQVFLFPNKKTYSYPKNILQSFGLSVIISGLIYLLISYVIGINLYSSFMSLFIWIIFWTVAGVLKRRSNKNQICYPGLNQSPNIPASNKLHKFQHIVITLIIFASVVSVITASNRTLPQFVEFYILGAEGNADYYYSKTNSSPLIATVGIINHGNLASFDLYYKYDEGENILLSSFSLKDGDEQQYPIELYPPTDAKKISFLLLRQDNNDVVHELHLWIGN